MEIQRLDQRILTLGNLGFRVFCAGRQPAGGWTPASPTTDGGVLPEHWYRSDDAYQDAGRITPCASDGDVVGSWTDLTANADHVSQGTTGNKPTWQNGAGDQLNGHPVIRGDGIDDWLQGAFTTGGAMAQPLTIIAVAAMDALAVNDGVARKISDGDDNTNRIIIGVNDAPAPDEWDLYAGNVISAGATSAGWIIRTALFNGANSQLWHAGISVVAGNAGTKSMDGLTLFADRSGATNWLDDIVEYLMYSSNLSDADKNQIGNYYAARYGLAYTNI